MKVTICFDDVKIIVPCGNQTIDDNNLNNAKVSDIIENAILRFKKATGKSSSCVIKVLNLQTIRDGGILDPDDYIKDVVEDKELLIAVYEEYQNEVLLPTNKPILNQLTISPPALLMDTTFNKPNSLNNSSMSNGSSTSTIGSNPGQYSTSNIYENKNFKMPYQPANPLDNYYYIQRNQVLVSQKDLSPTNNQSNLRVKSGSESCIYNSNKLNPPNLSLITVNTSNLKSETIPITMPENNTEANYFSRVSTNRQSIVKNENNLWSNPTNSSEENVFSIELINDSNRNQFSGPLGIHVIPSYDTNNQKDSGLIIQRIEPSGRVYKDGRLQTGDRIIEINRQNLIGVDFIKCQEFLREAIMSSSSDKGILELKISRTNENGESEKVEDKENSNELSNNFNSASTNLSALNTKKLGKKITVQLVKGPQGLGFKLAARDNCTPGEYSPIYIKNILPKGAAITDGRLQRGDRLLEVNKIDMTQKTLHEAVNILRNTKLGDYVEIVVSRQIINASNLTLPRELNEKETEVKNEEKNGGVKRELITFEIALNDTGSAGLGVSVKGKTKRLDDSDNSVDLGIFVKTVINGGAASKDGRLRANDQLININGFSLLGKSNEEAMLILREAMQVESRPGYIELTVSRKIKNEIKKEKVPEPEETRQFVKIIQHNNRKVDDVEEERISRFNRDAPNRRSMSEKRVKLGNVPANFQINKQRNQSSDPKRSHTVQIISNPSSNYTTQTLGRSIKHPTQLSNSMSQKISQIYTEAKQVESLNSDIENKKSTTCSISSSNYTFASGHYSPRVLNPKIDKQSFCIPITCKSSKFRSKKAEKALPIMTRKTVLSSSSSMTFSLSDSSESSLSPRDRNRFFIEALTYTKLKPIELIAEDFSDFSKHFTDEDETRSSTNSSRKSAKLKPRTKSCFNIKLLKQSNEQNLLVQDQSDSAPYYTEIKSMTRKSTSMESIPQNLSDTKPNRPVVNVHNKFGTVSGASIPSRPSVLDESSSPEPSTSRFRAVNRSFRTAVDKSLDVPVEKSEESSVSVDIKKTENKKHSETKVKESKSIIGKFQNLFKSHNSSKKHSNEEINQTPSNKQAVELVNFHKIESNSKLNAKPAIIPNPKTLNNNTDVLIENDTLYTQYRPSSCQPANLANHKNVSAPQKPYFANRESLFYHSTDNHRMTYSQRQQQFILEQQQILRQQQKKFIEQQEKLKEAEEQNRIIYQQREIKNYEELKSRKGPFIHHSIPFNGSNQIHPVAELFNEVVNQFDRLNVNQMSTKSQPPMSDNYQKEFLTCSKNGFVNAEIPLSGSGSSTMSSSSASSASSTSVSDRHQFYNQHSMLIQPHQV